MKNTKFKTYSLFFAALTSLVLILIACGSDQGNSSAETGDSTDVSAAESSDKKVLRVGTTGQSFGVRSIDGHLEGYDVDVLEAVGEKLGFEMDWSIAEFTGLFGMMDTGRIDTIANFIAVTEERDAKYDFVEPYAHSGTTLVVQKDRNDIQSLEDLKGKTLGVLLGNNLHSYIDEWNAENGNEITIKSYQDNAGTYNEVVIGRIDAFIDTEIKALSILKEEGLPLKLFSDKPLYYVDESFPFVRNDENKAFVEEFNQALHELRGDGTLKEISDKWSEVDVTTKKEK